MISMRSRFYDERDRRTSEYHGGLSRLELPVALVIGDDVVGSRAGQSTILALVNMVARAHRHVHLVLPDEPLLARSLVPADSLADATLKTMKAIDPYLDLAHAAGIPKASATLGIGQHVPADLSLYVGANGWSGEIADRPSAVCDRLSSILGGGLAACMGAAALFRAVHGRPTPSRRLSLWGFGEGALADPGPTELDPVDVGSVVVVGAGAVGSSLLYWLHEIGIVGAWWVVDGDAAELHNTNRSLGLLASDTGWPDGAAENKAIAGARLINAIPFPGWYDEWIAGHGPMRPDLILPLANEGGVQPKIAALGLNLLLHCSTSRDWTAELHRHIAGGDDCIVCRQPPDVRPQFACATGSSMQGSGNQSTGAALPFLSAGAGLVLAAALVQLQWGTLQALPHNHWRLHLGDSVSRLAALCSSLCRELQRGVTREGTHDIEPQRPLGHAGLIMEERLVGRLNLTSHTAARVRRKVDALQGRLPENWVSEQVRLAQERADRLSQSGVRRIMHPLASLIQRVHTQFDLLDMDDPVDPTQDMLTATGLESDIAFLEARAIEGLNERVAALHSEDYGEFEGTCFELRTAVVGADTQADDVA